MELAGKVVSGLLGLIVFGLIVGFVDAWREQRKWDKKNKKGGEFNGSKGFRSN